MKLIVTVKTGKGKKSSEKECYKTAKELEKVILLVDKKWQIKGLRGFCDGRQIILET